MAKMPLIFTEMQEKLEKPSCLGNYGSPAKDLKCGMCWFWPVCKKEEEGEKPTVKRGRPPKNSGYTSGVNK